MAQSTDIDETFLREVDDNLRRDRIRDFGVKYGVWLVGGLILFLAAVGALIWWQQHRAQLAQQHVEKLAQVYRDIGAGDKAGAAKSLDELAKNGSTAVRGSALFASAALALQKNDTKTAIARYQAIAANDDLPQPYRDAALMRQTALEFDHLKPEQVIARLQPLTKPGNPWFGSAGEMTAAALIKQGKTQEAGRLFAAIAKDQTVPDPIRARAVQIAGSLGVDASAALDQAAAKQDSQ